MTRPVKPCTEPSTCRSCAQLVLWVETSNGKKMPVDAAPTHKGNLVLTLKRAQNKLVSEGYNPAAHVGRNRYTSHFSTCPNAQQHRSGR